MLSLPVLGWVALGLGALVVGLSKTAMPGANTVAVGLFAAVLPARASTGVLLVLLMVGDLFAVWSYRRHADWQVLRRLAPPVLAGLAAGTAFLAVAGDAAVRRAIGAILLALLVVTVVRRARAGRPGPGEVRAGRVRRRVTSGAYGTLGGFTTMVANAGGPVMSLYFLATRLPVMTFLGTAAWFFFVVNLTKVPFMIGLGLVSPGSLLLDLVLVPGVVVGALAGRRLAPRIPQVLFDRLILALTVVAAGYLLLG
ncbi:sulfite exporter TauE/SafE family protein [Georgenia thermotolerans]|uniref:Probable membrane transporter protein n=1 Tax=Georgenia thermotolerans TaxID=527326 RepID=A0A7J5USS2_9MICO|nr:sulfite exporter TauE/SafE family protein [Georgenia thermotolerans]KAE8765502.1 TSUP family transporter [Georgenia thermotolerans]